MLTAIWIKGFKSVRDQQIELGQVNVFIGANGSGKSNLLEAVGMMSAAAGRAYVDARQLAERGVRHSPGLYKTSLKTGYESDEIKLYVISEKQDYGIYLHISSESISVEDEYPNSKAKGLPESPFENFEEMRRVRDYLIYTPTTPVLRGIQPDIMPSDPLGLLGGRLAEAVEDILDLENETLGTLDLDEVLDLMGWVDEFDITAPSRELLSPYVPSLRSLVRFRDAWMNEKRNHVSGYDASEGPLYVLFTLLLALHPRVPTFFAVDNFCQSMNPRLARGLTRLFCRLMLESDPPRQALLTTHSPLVLDGLDLRDDRIRLFAVDRSHTTGGATKVSRVRLSDEVLEKGKKGTPLSMMWSMGLLGGVPDIF
jgi:energy-coupling factor transporter ATP-binding protein EcfA2